MEGEELNTEALEQEVAKVTGEESQEETTTSKDEAKEEETNDSSSTDSHKPDKEEEVSEETEDKEKETKEDDKEDKEDEETRFDKHPRWQKLKQERDEALAQAQEALDYRQKLGGISADEMVRLKQAGELLRKYPTLAKNVQKMLDEFPYGNEEVTVKLNEFSQKINNLEQEKILEKYDRTVDSLISEQKIDKDVQGLVKEILDNRVIKNKIKDDEGVKKEFTSLMKDIERLGRKKLAGYMENKKSEKKVPANVPSRGKAMGTKSEATDEKSIIEELADGIKSGSSQFGEE
jgi:hypothetical protein